MKHAHGHSHASVDPSIVSTDDTSSCITSRTSAACTFTSIRRGRAASTITASGITSTTGYRRIRTNDGPLAAKAPGSTFRLTFP